MTLLNGELKNRARDGRATVRTVDSPEVLLEILERQFGLRFPPGTRFGAPGGPWPA